MVELTCVVKDIIGLKFLSHLQWRPWRCVQSKMNFTQHKSFHKTNNLFQLQQVCKIAKFANLQSVFRGSIAWRCTLFPFEILEFGFPWSHIAKSVNMRRTSFLNACLTKQARGRNGALWSIVFHRCGAPGTWVVGEALALLIRTRCTWFQAGERSKARHFTCGRLRKK